MNFQRLSTFFFAFCVGLTGWIPWLAKATSPSAFAKDLDPRLEEMTGFQPRCPNAEASHAWICGSVVELPGPHLSQVCTSKDEPVFVGSLSLPGEEPFYTKAMSFNYELPLEMLRHCTKGPSADIDNCAGLLLYSKSDERFGVFSSEPPDALPTDFPQPPYENRGHPLAPKHFAELDSEAIALSYTRLIGPRSGVSPDRCTLSVRLDELDIGLSLRMRCAEMQSWKSHMRAVIAGVRDGVVSLEPNASCNVPPENAIILGNRFSVGFRESMPRWLDLHR